MTDTHLNQTPFSRRVPIGPQMPPVATARLHPEPSKGHPVDAAPVPVVVKPASPPTNGATPPANAGAPPPTRSGRHVLRGPEEYPTDQIQDQRFYIQRPDLARGIVGDYPEGFDLQWVAVEVWGQPQPSMVAGFTRMGWEPVHTGDFDGRYDGRFVPRSQEGPIVLEGLMLVARSMSWSNKARAQAQRDAQAQVNVKVRQLQSGDLEKVTLTAAHKHLDKTNYVNMSMEGIHIPAPPQG